MAAIRFARDIGLPIPVRGGGHSYPGDSVCDAGIVIDLGLMKGIFRVDPQARTAVSAGRRAVGRARQRDPGVRAGDPLRVCRPHRRRRPDAPRRHRRTAAVWWVRDPARAELLLWKPSSGPVSGPHVEYQHSEGVLLLVVRRERSVWADGTLAAMRERASRRSSTGY
jgi:hypothetical protein